MTEMNETNPFTVLPGQERYVAPLDETPLKAVDSMDESAPASSMWADAWRTTIPLIRLPLAIRSASTCKVAMFTPVWSTAPAPR